MFFHCCAKDYYIIQICYGKVKILQNSCHQFLEILLEPVQVEKGTLMYSYFPKGELYVVLGIEDFI